MNKFEKALKENREASQLRLKQEMARQKKQNKINSIIITLTIGVIFVLFLTIMNGYTNEAVQSCMNDNHSYSYCIERLG